MLWYVVVEPFQVKGVAARGRSLEGRVTAKRGWILGGDVATDRRPDDAPARSRDDAAMLIHCEESATTKTAPFRRNPSGAGGFGPQALSLVGRDAKTAPAASVSNLRWPSSLLDLDSKTHRRHWRYLCYRPLVGRESFPLGEARLRKQHVFPYGEFEMLFQGDFAFHYFSSPISIKVIY